MQNCSPNLRPLLSICILAALHLTVSGCGDAGVSVDSTISANQAIEIVKRDKDVRPKLLISLQHIQNRADQRFDWHAWWNWLKDQPPLFAGDDEYGWNGVFSLGHHSCRPNSTSLNAYVSYLEKLMDDKVLSPATTPLRGLLQCDALLSSESIDRISLFSKVARSSPADYELIEFFSKRFEPADYNRINANEWGELFSNIRSDLQRNAKHPKALDVFISRLTTNTEMDRELTSALYAALGNQEVLIKLPARSQIALVELGRQKSIESNQGLDWWKYLATSLIRNFEKGDVDLNTVIQHHDTFVSQYTTYFENKFSDPDIRARELSRWLETFDQIFDELYQVLKNREVNEQKNDQSPSYSKEVALFHTSINGMSSNLRWWLFTLLFGSADTRFTFMPNMDPYSKHPFDWTILNRIYLRKKYAEYDVLKGKQTSYWWETGKDVCPVPNFNDQLKLSGIFVEIDSLSQIKEPGCYRYSGRETLRGAMNPSSYDTFLHAPGAHMEFSNLERAVVDVSGEQKLNYDPELIRQDAKVFPLILTSTDSITKQERWFVFHFVSQEAGPTNAKWLTPPQGESGGTVSIANEPTLPTWVRALGADSTPALTPVPGGFGDQSNTFDPPQALQDDRWLQLRKVVTAKSPAAIFVSPEEWSDILRAKDAARLANQSIKILDLESLKMVLEFSNYKTETAISKLSSHLDKLRKTLSPIESTTEIDEENLWNVFQEEVKAQVIERAKKADAKRYFDPLGLIILPAHSERLIFSGPGLPGDRGMVRSPFTRVLQNPMNRVFRHLGSGRP